MSCAVTLRIILSMYITCTLHDCVSGCLQIEMNVGQCRPLATIYSDAYEVACLEAVDGLVRDAHCVVPACEVVVYTPLLTHHSEYFTA